MIPGEKIWQMERFFFLGGLSDELAEVGRSVEDSAEEEQTSETRGSALCWIVDVVVFKDYGVLFKSSMLVVYET